jgi:hypothetical protein
VHNSRIQARPNKTVSADLRERSTPKPRHISTDQRAVVALKVRELLQPAAKERQGERTDLKPKAKNISPDLGESSPKPIHLNPGQRAVVALKVRELLQPAAKERQAEAGRSAAPWRPAEKVSADLR